jgi:hypothetical protein
MKWSVHTSRIALRFQVRQEPTQVKHLSDAQLKGRLLVLPTNKRIGLERLGADTSFKYSYFIAVKSFTTLDPVQR